MTTAMAPKHERMPALAVLAGGLATRLRPITATIPKSMVVVADEPFIAHQLRLFVRHGITDIVLCTGFLGNQIEEFVGDGHRFGCRVRYSTDGNTQLGTGGALRRALVLLGERFLVTYGDSYLDTDFQAIWRAFCRSEKPALMTVFRNEGRWDTSNAEYTGDGVVRRYDKVNRTPSMQYIDYGVGALQSWAIAARPEGVFDLGDVYRDLAAEQALAGYEVRERFYEIGSLAGMAETDAFLRRASPTMADTARRRSTI